MTEAYSKTPSARYVTHGQPVANYPLGMAARIVALLAAMLLSIPKLRLVIGAPLYFVDALAAGLLAYTLSPASRTWRPESPILKVVGIYLFFVIVSEIRGMVAYDTPAQSMYMMVRWLLAASLAFSVPRLIASEAGVRIVLKGVVISLLFTAFVVIGYSLGPTRDLVVRLVFNTDFINPGWESLIRAAAVTGEGEAAMRGRSPIGAATMTAGFLAIAWPLSFAAYRNFRANHYWRLAALVASLLAPIAMLMTYGRAAWLMVGAIAGLAAFFNLAGARRNLILGTCVLVVALTQIKFDSSLLFVDRVTREANISLERPMQDKSTRERLLSFVEPFGHLLDNPVWLFAGSGRAGKKALSHGLIEEQLYEEGQLATHSGFAMAYYSFGFMAALCQVAILLLGYRLILRRLRLVGQWAAELRISWQSLLMSWVGMTLWWSAGHAIVGEPRGAMLQFLMVGLLVTLDKLTRIRWYALREANAGGGS